MTQRRNISRYAPIAALAIACAAVTAVPARASTFSATELTQDAAILSQFNLVNLNDFTSTATTSALATIQGRVLVGGNATFSGAVESICGSACAANTTKSIDANGNQYGALTVFGNVVAGSNGVTTNSAGGSINIGGNLTGNLNLGNTGSSSVGVVGNGNGSTITGAQGGVRTGVTSGNYKGTVTNSGPINYIGAAGAFPYNTNGQTAANTVQNPLIDLSRGIAKLPGTPGVTAQALPSGSNVFLSTSQDYFYANNTKSYGVVTTTADNLASETSFNGIQNGSGNQATFVIVTGQLSSGNKLPTLTNVYSNVIYDFVDATSLAFTGQWNASILAPLATITSEAGTINGSVIVASMTQTQALNVGNVFTGDLSGLNLVQFRRVPEPASLALIGVGLAAAALTRRRRK